MTPLRRTLPALAGLLTMCVLTIVGIAVAGRGSHAGGDALARASTALPASMADRPAPRIRLPDAATGRRLDTRSLLGHPYAVTFLYTQCPDVCPIIGAELQQALADLGAQAGRVAVVAVSVDPAHDSPAAIRSWLKEHHEPRNFHYLVAPRRVLTPVWKSYFAAPQVPDDPESSHTAAIWFVDARGRRKAVFSAGSSVTPSVLAAEFRKLLSQS